MQDHGRRGNLKGCGEVLRIYRAVREEEKVQGRRCIGVKEGGQKRCRGGGARGAVKKVNR